MKLAFEDGTVIEQTDDGISISNRFGQADDEQWRIDLHRIEQDASDAGQPITVDIAWARASKEAVKRITGSANYSHPKGNPNNDKESSNGEDDDSSEDVA